jgi:hypothetical protein
MNQSHHRDAPQSARPVHHSPIFWVGVVLFLIAITVYVLSDDLMWWPFR